MGKIDVILLSMQEEMPFGFVIPDRVKPYLHEAFHIYAKAAAEDVLKRAADENKDMALDAYESILSTEINLDL